MKDKAPPNNQPMRGAVAAAIRSPVISAEAAAASINRSEGDNESQTESGGGVDEELGQQPQSVAQYPASSVSTGPNNTAATENWATPQLENPPYDDDSNLPVPISQIAASFHAMDDAIKTIKNATSEEPALPPAHDAAFYEGIEEHNNSKKKAKSVDVNAEDPPIPVPVAHTFAANIANEGTGGVLSSEIPQPTFHQDEGSPVEPSFEVQHRSIVSSSVAVSSASSPPSRVTRMEHDQGHNQGNATVISSPPPRSTLIGEVTAANDQSTSPAPFHEVQATFVDTELYEATIVSSVPNEGDPFSSITSPTTNVTPRRSQKCMAIVLVCAIGILGGTISPTSSTSGPSLGSSLRPSYTPSTLPSETPTTLPSSIPSQSPTGSICLLVTTDSVPANDGPVDVFVDSGNGFVLVNRSGKVYGLGDIVVDQCFDTIVGVQVRNQSINSWTGTFQLSIDGKGTYHKLTCPDCTGATNTMSITADGNADSGSGCLNGRMCALKTPSFIWKQVGKITKNDATGEGDPNHYAGKVAMSGDGTIIAIGEKRNDGGGIDSGRVDTYFWDEGTSNYEPLGEPIIGQAAGDHLGAEVALSKDGKTLAVGAPWNGDYGTSAGQVKLFSLEDDRLSWKEHGHVLHGEAGDGFGHDVSISANGKILAISSYTNEFVKVYMQGESSSNYEQLGDTIMGEAMNGNFGWTIHLSADGTTLAASAPWYNSSAGQVRVYRIDDSGLSWEQLGQELIGEAANQLMGWTVAISGDGTIVCISARNIGRIYRFDSDTQMWNLIQTMTNAGSSIDISPDAKTLAYGTRYGSANGIRSGLTEVYRWDAAASDYKKLEDLHGKGAGDNFGDSVALSSDGMTLAVLGGWYNTGSENDRPGYAQIYKLENSTLL